MVQLSLKTGMKLEDIEAMPSGDLCLYAIELGDDVPIEARIDWGLARIVQTLSNIHRDRKRNSRGYDLKKFLPNWQPWSAPRQVKSQTADEMLEVLTLRFGAPDQRRVLNGNTSG